MYAVVLRTQTFGFISFSELYKNTEKLRLQSQIK